MAGGFRTMGRYQSSRGQKVPAALVLVRRSSSENKRRRLGWMEYPTFPVAHFLALRGLSSYSLPMIT